MKTIQNTRREFLKAMGLALASVTVPRPASARRQYKRPNILFCLADDWSWPHAGIAGDRVVRTPTFDRVAREGVLFENAFVSSPSCTPSRGAILTGQWHWRLEEGGNLWSTLAAKFHVYPDLLEQAGYPANYAEPVDIDVSNPRPTKFGYADTDGSPTKSYMIKHRDNPKAAKLFELAFGKRPAEELYDLGKDPAQLNNVAGKPEYAKVQQKLADTMMAELKATKDPRVLGNGDIFETYPYYGGGMSDKPGGR